jgi:methylated-DNA-protein-cysteine methyltransferase-like protein
MAGISRAPKPLFRPPASRGPRSRAARSAADNPVLQTIWDIVAMIPRGRVSTYGQVARAAGLLRGARQAGYALRMMPAGMRLPWHRVVGAGGRIVFPPVSAQHREQARRLRAEGVVVSAGRVAASAMTTLEEL